MNDEYHFAELTKEMIVSRLKESNDAPSLAAEIARGTIIAGVKATQASGQSPRATVSQICFGAMSGLMLIEKSLPEGSVRILQCLAEVAHELNMDPAEMMTWALEGVAKLSPLVSADTRWKIRSSIEESFSGTAEVFDQFANPPKRPG